MLTVAHVGGGPDPFVWILTVTVCLILGAFAGWGLRCEHEADQQWHQQEQRAGLDALTHLYDQDRDRA